MRRILFLAIVSLLLACTPEEGSRVSAQEMPASRSFHMGFTPLPYDFTEAAFADTYERIAANGDIIAHHLDEGVPWTEALENRPYADNVRQDIQRRVNGTPAGKAVFLSITPLALTRTGLAQYWSADSHMENPASFQDAPLDSDQVKQAFTAYALEMIRTFRPKYFAYAIEISDLADAGPTRDAFVALAAHVYREVKAAHPDLMVFPTYTLGNGDYLDRGLASLMRDLAPYTDVVAVSTYPYVWDGVGGDASRLPADWFSKVGRILPDKPFAVAETGFLGGDYTNLMSLVWINSSTDSQAAYVRRLFGEADALDAEFVIWYVPRDYDPLWEKMRANGMNRWFAQWMRTGLWTAGGEGRPALTDWQAWLALPRR